ncbi:unnamed protein product [Mytilus coruscus]|uniref:Reverse transcriptase domain-containing protein n=1 Tax=Mytilus coruscus TaxID=42192 RepID=A0A6J8CDS7_MYTCO|nr:unnamed protein product [Mytilus coruscus]
MKCDSSDSRNIPPLQIDDDLICDDTKKAKIFNDYFCGQSNLDDSNTHLPDIPDTRTEGLGDMIISENEVVDILKILDVSKASGPDRISPRLLKEAYGILKYSILKPTVCAVDDPRESANNLNSDLAKIHRWSSNWLVTFNPQKTETMTISRKFHKPDHPKLNMNNVTVTETGPSFCQTGPSFCQTGSSFCQTGPSFCQTGPSFCQTGSFLSQIGQGYKT